MTELKKEELAVVERDDIAEVNELNFNDGNKSYCSVKATDLESKKKLYNIASQAGKKVTDMIGEVIDIKDVYVEIIDITNSETGEISKAPRILLIDPQGITYQSVSAGMFNSLKRIFNIFGMPTYETPLKAKIKQVNLDGGKRTLTLELV